MKRIWKRGMRNRSRGYLIWRVSTSGSRVGLAQI